MDEQQNMDSSREKHHTVTESCNQRQQTKSLEDIMYQRMKNRERQRRYRERKRLLADMNNNCVNMNEPTPPPLPLPPPPSSAIEPYQCVTPIRRTRDWKKDARRAHTAKQETADAVPQHNQYLTHGNQVSCLVSGVKSSEHKSKNYISTNPSAVENGEKSKVKSIRRDWKAEARNKKGETK